ncbi:hypothetical protein B0H13DRAFT_2323374 [Mycena leptocephala]|nr:hypothetical protein B0H13DRAFT_2323374 [Mycena leptocephala]
MRAKSIRNKPELNQRTTRNSLLKETASSEAKKQVEIVEGQMRTVRDEFEQSIALLKKRESELKDTQDQLQETEEVLDRKQVELKLVQGALEEETVVRQAHQETERRLNGVALGLKVVVRDSVKDVGGLFDKLERRSSILHTNSQAVLTHGKTTSAATIALSCKLEEFLKASSQSTTKLRTEAKQFEAKELEALTGHLERVDQQLKGIHSALAVVHAKDTAEAEALAVVQTTLKETQEAIRLRNDVHGNQRCGTRAFTTAEKVLEAMGALVENVVREARSFFEAERDSVVDSKMLASNAAAAEMSRLRNQNELLTRMLEDEKLRGEKVKDELLQRVSGLLGEVTKERDRGLRDAVGILQDGNFKAEEGMKVLSGNTARSWRLWR